MDTIVQTHLRYRCPGCGSNMVIISPGEGQDDAVICQYCGTKMYLAMTEYERSLKYLREKDIRKEARDRDTEAYARKERQKGLLGLILFIVILSGYLILREHGVI